MRPEKMNVQEGYRLANGAIAHVLSRATQYISHERQSLERANQSEITMLQAKEECLLDRWQSIQRRFQEVVEHGYRVHQQNGNRSGRAWSLSIAVSLVLAAFLFAVKTIEPFDLGWMGWAYCIALSIALPFALDRFLEDFRHRAVERMLVSAALVTSLATALLFGMLRGDVLAHSLNAIPAVVINSLDPPELPTGSADTEPLVASLRLVWGLAALAFELMGGLAIHDFREARRAFAVGALHRLQQELLKVEKEWLQVTQRLHQLLSQPASLEAAFWSDFERGLHDGRIRQ